MENKSKQTIKYTSKTYNLTQLINQVQRTNNNNNRIKATNTRSLLQLNYTTTPSKNNYRIFKTMSFKNFVNNLNNKNANILNLDNEINSSVVPQIVFNIRFAVNGLSKFYQYSNSVPAINKSIQAGDFGDDAGMIAENSKCVVIGIRLFA